MIGACSDDGVPGQGQNSSGASSGDAATTVQSPPGLTEGEGTGGGASTGAAGTSGLSDSSGDDGATTGVSGPPEATTTSTSSGDTTEGSTSDSSTGDSSTGGSSSGDSSGTTTGEVCEPITDDPSGIGAVCLTDLDCEPGYTCQPFEGFVLDLTCQIICTDTCECPLGLSCTFTEDKIKSWFQCTP